MTGDPLLPPEPDSEPVKRGQEDPARLVLLASRFESRLLQRLPAAIVVTDEGGQVVYWNDRAVEMFGYSRDRALGRSVSELNVGPNERHTGKEIMASIRRNGRWEGDYDARREDGSVLATYTTIEAMDDPETGFSGLVGASVDHTDRRQLESDLAYAALHDALTGLPNRRLFLDSLEAALSRSSRSGRPTAVLFMDLDDFKEVNDVGGHAAGDAVLRTMADLVSGLVRDGDVVARLGGDEFVVCCEELNTTAEALVVAERVLQSLRAPFRLGGVEFLVSASVGIAISTPGGDAEALIRRADSAMYTAKQAGRGRIELFDDDVHEAAAQRHRLAGDLATGLRRGEFEVFYQPEVRIDTGELFGFEALVRWHHPERGMVPPDEFISIAEERGLIHGLGEQVLRAACHAMADWVALAPEQNLTVAVNVSGRQLEDDQFPAKVALALADAEIPPGRLCLEVTESALLDDRVATRALRALKALGVLIAIDDFGTGYSSLSRLKRFPVDFLKIDRSFVDGIGRDPEDDVIVSTVMGLARSLGLDVVAEGIETGDQLQRLADLGCELGQGYYWERPIDEATATDIVRTRPTGWTHAIASSTVEAASDDGGGVPIDAKTAVAVLAHELTSPLTALAGFAELLLESLDDETRAVASRAVQRNARLARSALNLVADIADLEEGALRLRCGEIHLLDVVTDAVMLAEARPTPVVTFAVGMEDVPVWGDADRLVSALSNLLSNARKYSPEEGTVRVWSEVGAQTVALHVTDDGTGVPPDRVGLIFRKFGRADRTRAGSGLGLYLARGIARAHGGELSYRRAPGGGADFVLELPLR